MICEGLELPPEITAKFAGMHDVTALSPPTSRDDYVTTVPALRTLITHVLVFLSLSSKAISCLTNLHHPSILRLLSFAFLPPACLSLTELSVGCVCINLTHALRN